MLLKVTFPLRMALCLLLLLFVSGTSFASDRSPRGGFYKGSVKVSFDLESYKVESLEDAVVALKAFKVRDQASTGAYELSGYETAQNHIQYNLNGLVPTKAEKYFMTHFSSHFESASEKRLEPELESVEFKNQNWFKRNQRRINLGVARFFMGAAGAYSIYYFSIGSPEHALITGAVNVTLSTLYIYNLDNIDRWISHRGIFAPLNKSKTLSKSSLLGKMLKWTSIEFAFINAVIMSKLYTEQFAELSEVVARMGEIAFANSFLALASLTQLGAWELTNFKWAAKKRNKILNQFGLIDGVSIEVIESLDERIQQQLRGVEKTKGRIGLVLHTVLTTLIIASSNEYLLPFISEPMNQFESFKNFGEAMVSFGVSPEITEAALKHEGKYSLFLGVPLAAVAANIMLSKSEITRSAKKLVGEMLVKFKNRVSRVKAHLKPAQQCLLIFSSEAMR